jgi:hypothetical protein
MGREAARSRATRKAAGTEPPPASPARWVAAAAVWAAATIARLLRDSLGRNGTARRRAKKGKPAGGPG